MLAMVSRPARLSVPLQRLNLDRAKRFRVRKCNRGSHTARSGYEPHTPGGTIVHGRLAVSPGNRSPFSDVFLLAVIFEITEMCKNVDDCIKSDCGDKGLCRDPVGVTVCRGTKRS